jgi:phosphoribosyl-ATP pyrophosphohydrolase
MTAPAHAEPPPVHAVPDPAQDFLARLADVIESRKPVNGGDPAQSYVARLFAKGLDAMLKKVGEEATETVMAAKDGVPAKVVYEVADLWFHSMIVLAEFGLRPADVLTELARREGMSGLQEFAQRNHGAPETEADR